MMNRGRDYKVGNDLWGVRLDVLLVGTEFKKKDLFFEISLRLGKIKEVLREIESINDKGFVNSFDLSNSSKYPNFSKLIKVFVNEIDLLKSKELIQLTK